MMRFVRRLWRVTVLAAAALAFLLAWFLDYDGLGQVLGLGGTAGRIALAALAAAVIALVVARFTREPPAAPTPARKTPRKTRRAKPASARKPVTRRATARRSSPRR